MTTRSDSQVVGSANTTGLWVKVHATATVGTQLHVGSGGNSWDVLTLWAVNTDTSARTLTVEWGGVAAENLIVKAYSLGASGKPEKIADRIPLKRGQTVGAFASVADVINCLVIVEPLE